MSRQSDEGSEQHRVERNRTDGGDRAEGSYADAGAWYRSLVAPIRFAQFLSVGFVGALVDNTLLVGLVELAAIAPSIAAIGAKEGSILVMFAINERWTFRDARDGERAGLLRRLVKSNAVRAGGAVVGIATLVALTRGLGLWYLAANVVGIGVGFVFNYVLESIVTWRVHEE